MQRAFPKSTGSARSMRAGGSLLLTVEDDDGVLAVPLTPHILARAHSAPRPCWRREQCGEIALNYGLLRDFDPLLKVEWPAWLLEELYLAESLLQPFNHGPHWCLIVAVQVGADGCCWHKA